MVTFDFQSRFNHPNRDVDSSASPSWHYVRGLRYIDECVRRDRDTTGNGCSTSGFTRFKTATGTSVTDENGDVQGRYAYAAYGEPLFLTPGFEEQSGSSFRWEVPL